VKAGSGVYVAVVVGHRKSGRRAHQRAHRSRMLDSGRAAWSYGKAKSILTAATTHRAETLDQTP